MDGRYAYEGAVPPHTLNLKQERKTGKQNLNAISLT